MPGEHDSVKSEVLASIQTGDRQSKTEELLAMVIEHMLNPKHESAQSMTQRELDDILYRIKCGGMGDNPTRQNSIANAN